ncbi:MAG: hypothetical protein EOP07_05550 [Proteobacteria bacterium]|nr:MAG: hypothetical protein EOP07_05550 [Pseudomonadota bacterium]
MAADAKAPHGIFDMAASSTLGMTTAIVYASVGVLLIFFFALAYVLWRRKKKRKPQPIPALSPWERLDLELKALEQNSSSSEVIGILNHSLRQGLELRLGKPYTAFTSSEILAHLQKNSEFSSDFQADCAEFLKTADKVLFAHRIADEEERKRWEKQVGLWLNSLKVGQAL